MKSIQIILLLLISTQLFSQTSFKPVIEQEWQEGFVNDDTNIFVIQRIDTNDFRKLLNLYPHFAIEFLQPWCPASVESMKKAKALQRDFEKKNIGLILICDTRFRDKYFKVTKDKIGIVTHSYNKYGIDFPTYIISGKESIDDYKGVLQRSWNKKVKTNYFCFLFEGQDLKYQNYSYKFYQKFHHP